MRSHHSYLHMNFRLSGEWEKSTEIVITYLSRLWVDTNSVSLVLLSKMFQGWCVEKTTLLPGDTCKNTYQ